MVKYYTLADIDIPSAGTRVQVSSSQVICSTIVIQAKATNTGLVFVGDSNVSATRGISLAAGDVFSITGDQSGRPGADEMDLSDFYVDAATNGDDVKVSYVSRR